MIRMMGLNQNRKVVMPVTEILVMTPEIAKELKAQRRKEKAALAKAVREMMAPPPKGKKGKRRKEAPSIVTVKLKG